MPPEDQVQDDVELPVGDVIDDTNDDSIDDSTDGDVQDDNQSNDEDSPEEVAEARRIYKLLKDPKTATSLVRELAHAEGLLDGTPNTPKDIKTAKASIKDILKEKLGDKYDFLTPALAEAFETILAGERETQQQSIQQMQIDQTKRETTDVLSKLAKETKGESRKVESRMLELMNEFQIGPGVPIEKYLRGLYAQASAARTATNAKNTQNDKIRRNANDAPSRLQSSSSGAENTRIKDAGIDPNKPMTLKESVAFAVAQQSRQGTRK